MTRRLIAKGFFIVFCCFGPSWVEAGFDLTVNAAGSQSSTVSGVMTETFNSFTPGNYTTLNTAIGSISSPGLAIVGANQYGGAGGTGNYLAIGAESGQLSATLTLTRPQDYFGFEWSAADSQNQIEFLSGGKVVAKFNPTSALGALGSAYYGNPVTSQDQNEKFAYINLIGTAGSTFDQVIFSNLNNATGFETDNWSILATQVNSPNTGTAINGLSSVPEPSSLILCGSGILTLFSLEWQRRRKRRLFAKSMLSTT